MRNPRIMLMISAAAVLVLVTAMPALALSDAADGDDVKIVDHGAVDLSAGSSATIRLVVVNTLPGGTGLADQRVVEVSVGSPDSRLKAQVDNAFFVLDGQGLEEVRLTIASDRYIDSGTYVLDVGLTVRSADPADASVVVSSYALEVDLVSALDGGDSFNRVLGVFENRLPAPFNGPLGTAVLTFVLVSFIGLAVIMVAGPVLMRIVFHNRPPEQRDRYRVPVVKFLLMIVAVYAFGRALEVYGAPVGIVVAFATWSRVLYILLGAVVVWKVYEAFVGYTLSRLQEDAPDDAGGPADLEPLLRLVGKVTVATFAAAAVVAGFGMSLAAIVTSAGLVTLGITYGAQNVLNQFFNGVVLLITRPFKKGDLVQIGAGTDVYKVRKVSVMNTVFDNWFNNDVVIMPNDAVASASISNLTGKTLAHRIQVSMSFAYGTDIGGVRRIMEETASAHPEVVTDGTSSMPYTIATGFNDASVQVRLIAYVTDVNNRSRISSELGVRLYERFMADSVGVMHPRTDVHILDPDADRGKGPT